MIRWTKIVVFVIHMIFNFCNNFCFSFPPDYGITQVEAMTVLCHFCLLDSACKNQPLVSFTGSCSSHLFNNLTNLIIPSPVLTLSVSILYMLWNLFLPFTFLISISIISKNCIFINFINFNIFLTLTHGFKKLFKKLLIWKKNYILYSFVFFPTSWEKNFFFLISFQKFCLVHYIHTSCVLLLSKLGKHQFYLKYKFNNSPIWVKKTKTSIISKILNY